MTVLRSLLTTVGLGLAALGLFFVVIPDASALLPLSRVGVVLLGLFALIEGARSLRARWRTRIAGATTADPEARHEADWPGDDFDDRVAHLTRIGGRWGGSGHERLHRRLKAAAVEAAAHRWRLSNDEARERVEAGEWTDDPAAAWFLGDEAVPAPPWTVRIRAFFGDVTPIGFYANRTADAIVALREVP